MPSQRKTPTGASAVDLAVLTTTVGHVQDDVGDIKQSIAGINDSLKVLGRIEERQLGVVRDFNTLASDKDDIVKRVSHIETELPGLREMRSWVIKGVAAGVSMLFFGVVSLVGSVFVDRFIPRQYVSTLVENPNQPRVTAPVSAAAPAPHP